MSLNHISDSLNLLGQATNPAAAPVHLETGEGPKLDVAWGSFHQGIGSSIAAVLTWNRVPTNFLDGSFFKECWVERRIPRRAIVAAALWHIVFIIMPSPRFPAAATHFSAFDNTELTWSGPITDFPLVEMNSSKPKPSPRGEPAKPLPPEGADAFHPRQRIITDPIHPTHPRQMLINSAAPLEPPKILPNLPTLDQKLADIAPSMLPNAPARPKLELNAGTAPRAAQRAQTGDVVPAPEVNSAQSGIPNGNTATFVALSAAPGPPAPVVPPQGHLAARVSLSPEGKQPGVPGGSPNGTPGANGGAGGGPASSGGNGTGNGSAKNG